MTLLNKLEKGSSLSPAQEDGLFQKIRALGNRPGWKGLADKWTAQFAISFDKIEEVSPFIIDNVIIHLAFSTKNLS